MDSALDRFPEYLNIKHQLENGGLEEGQEIGLVLEKTDLPLVGTKNPARNLTDNFRRLIEAYGLKDHSVVKYLSEHGNWLVYIRREKRKKEKTVVQEEAHQPARSA